MEKNQDGLQGLRVLVVEDETLVAMLVEEFLAELGCTVAGSIRRVDKALEQIEPNRIDAAILDVNLAGEDVDPVARMLAGYDIPFVFASGYGGVGLAGKWPDSPVVQKPFTCAELRQALSAAVKRDAANSVSGCGRFAT
jgi:CheY-like chemotaxis protein